MNYEFLRQVRIYELAEVVRFFPRGARVLDLGAGAGWQARELALWGFQVQAIDIPGSAYSQLRVWPVQEYEGLKIPCEDAVFDVVLCSTVLDLISNLDDFFSEVRRVLRPNGLAVFVVASGTWRFWTNVVHYAYLAEQLFARIQGRMNSWGCQREDRWQGPLQWLPSRHGCRGNVLTEMYYLSRFFWGGAFRRRGWHLAHRAGTGIFYTGYFVLGEKLPVERRKSLSRFVGSSTIIYVTEGNKKDPSMPGESTAYVHARAVRGLDSEDPVAPLLAGES